MTENSTFQVKVSPDLQAMMDAADAEGNDEWQMRELAAEAAERDATARIQALNAALHSHGGSHSDQNTILRAANAYYDFLTAKPAEPTRQ